ncbi:DUF7266 family protein [Halobellus rubicundus]|uniref:Uncharacterized protein n=1 Tax=Halobellus rubicundus TaxID=2996466 RepID=A0ABD5MFT2_9EURY
MIREPRGTGGDADRAVSITVNYVIALAITAVLISGLLIGAGGYVEDQRDRVVREELDVVAEQLAAGIADADRLAAAEAVSRSVRVGVDLPRRVARESYRIEVTEIAAPGSEPARHDLTLRAARSDVSVTLTLTTSVDLTEGSTAGGWTVVRLDAANDTLVVADGDREGTLALEPMRGV